MIAIPVPAPDQSREEKPPASIKTRAFKIFREFTSILFWVYALSKVFFFDIDIYIASHVNADMIWLLDYKPLLFLSVVALLALFTGTRNALWFVTFVLLYPLILIFWKLPYFIFKRKSWFLVFHIITFLASFIRTFRYRVISLAASVIAFIVCVDGSNRSTIIVAIVVMLVLLFASFVRAIFDMVRPNAVFELYNKVFTWMSRNYPLTIQNREQVKGLTVISMNETQIEIYKTYLGSTVAVNRVLLFVANKIRGYQKSYVGVIGGIGVFLFLWIYTIIAFAAVNNALFTLCPSAYVTQGQISFFVTPKLGESGMSQVSWKGVWLVDFPRRRAANLNQGWDGSPGRSRRVDRLAEAADCGA